MIDKDDCISITDRTFDLSLDEPLSDASSTAVDSITDHGATTLGGPPPPKNRLQSILTEDITAGGRDNDRPPTRFTDAQPRWGAPQKVHTPLKQVSRTATSIHQEKTVSTVADNDSGPLINKLKTAIHLLIHLSGNTIDATPDDMDFAALVEMVAKLTEASDYKMRFLTKNYSFLESMYDATRRELDSTKAEHQRSAERIHHLEEELHEQEEKQHALRQQLQLREDRQRTMLGQNVSHHNHNYSADIQEAKDIIERQQREIKEYKLFIKQMMDRE